MSSSEPTGEEQKVIKLHEAREAREASYGEPIDLVGLWDEEMPEREWLIDGLLPRGEVAQLAGWHGAGKSRQTLAMALAAASGTDFYGHDVPEPLTVAILTAEDDLIEVKRRLLSLAKAMGYTRERAEAAFQRIGVWDFKGIFAPLVSADRDGANVDKFVQGLFIEKLGGYDLAIIDTLTRFHAVNENGNMEMAVVLTALEKIQKESDCTLLVVHHTSRSDKSSGRGASSFESGVRCQLILQSLDDVQLKKLCLDPAEDKAIELWVKKLSYGPDGARLKLWDRGTHYDLIDFDKLQALRLRQFWMAWESAGEPDFSARSAYGTDKNPGFAHAQFSRDEIRDVVRYGQSMFHIVGAANQKHTFNPEYNPLNQKDNS